MKLSKNKKNKIVILSKIKFKDWYILVQQKIALDAIERRYPEKKEREREGKKNKIRENRISVEPIELLMIFFFHFFYAYITPFMKSLFDLMYSVLCIIEP